MTAPWDEVGDRIYRRHYRSLDLNIGLVVTDESVVVIDSRANHRQADELRSEIGAITRLPISTLINTHHHWDHTFGNARFPEATIVGHERTRAALVHHGEAMRAELLASGRIAPAERRLFEEVTITPPGETFSETMGVTIGGRHLDLRHLGRGHTDSDIVVSIDDVVFAGDLVEQGAPPAFEDSYPRRWVETLDRLIPLIGGPVVPGHGDVVDRAYVDSQRRKMQDAIDSIDRGDPVSGPYPETVMGDVARRLR